MVNGIVVTKKLIVFLQIGIDFRLYMQNPQNFGNFARVYATSQVLCQSTNTFAIKGIIWELYATENVIGKYPTLSNQTQIALFLNF